MLTSVSSLTWKSAICSWSFLKLANLFHVFCSWILITSSFKLSKMLVHDFHQRGNCNNTIKTTHPFRISKWEYKVSETWLLLYWQVAWTTSSTFWMRLSEKAAQSFLLILNFCGHRIDRCGGMITVRIHTLTIPMMANASTTAAFRGGKASPDAATTWSAESPPVLIACRGSFPAGFNRVVFILLLVVVSLVTIVAFAFMMMVVDNRNGWSVNWHAAVMLWSHATWPQRSSPILNDNRCTGRFCFLRFADPMLL